LFIETEGGVDLIGPKGISLLGGAVGFWVKSNGQSDIGKVKIKTGEEVFSENISIKIWQVAKNE